jgi:hypothetical protein
VNSQRSKIDRVLRRSGIPAVMVIEQLASLAASA